MRGEGCLCQDNKKEETGGRCQVTDFLCKSRTVWFQIGWQDADSVLCSTVRPHDWEKLCPIQSLRMIVQHPPIFIRSFVVILVCFLDSVVFLSHFTSLPHLSVISHSFSLVFSLHVLFIYSFLECLNVLPSYCCVWSLIQFCWPHAIIVSIANWKLVNKHIFY